VTDYRIMCVTLDQPTAHKHIVGVGTANSPSQPLVQWTIAQLRSALSAGDRFYTYAVGSNAAVVEPFTCDCGYITIRSSADATLANNLDRLRECPR